MLLRVSQMNPSAAKLAAMLVKTQEAIPTAPVRCSTLFAHPAENLAKFLSSLGTTVLYTAATALQITEANF
jgi:hypothetical protein